MIALYFSISCLMFAKIACGAAKLDPLHKDVYYHAKSAKFCVERASQTEIFGCSSKFGGNVGVLVYLHSDSEYETWLKMTKEISQIIVILESIIRPDRINYISKIPTVVGIIIFTDKMSELNEGFSPEDSFPVGPDTKKVYWNKNGLNLINSYVPFPIALVHNETEQAVIFKCIQDGMKEFNETSKVLDRVGRCAAKMESFMLSNKLQSQRCLKIEKYSAFAEQHICQPLQASNIYIDLQDKAKTQTKVKKIMVTANIDFRSLFYSLEGAGMESELSAAIIWLSLLDTINRTSIEASDAVSRIKDKFLFALFDGESWSHMGSSGLAYKMQNGSLNLTNSNISLDDIEMVIELSQLGLTKTSTLNTFFHYDKDSYSKKFKKEIDDAVSKFKEASQDVTFATSTASEMPPTSSSKPFVKLEAKFPWIMLSDYDSEFLNKFYHHIHDNYEYAESMASPFSKNYSQILVSRSRAIAAGLLKIAGLTNTEEVKKKATPNATLISELVECVGKTMNCSLARSLYSQESIKSEFFDGKALNRDILVMDVESESPNPPASYVVFFARVSALLSGHIYECNKSEDKAHCFKKHKIEGNVKLNFITTENLLISAPVYVDSFTSKYLFDRNATDFLFTESGWVSTSLKIFHAQSLILEVIIFSYGFALCVLVSFINHIVEKFRNSSA